LKIALERSAARAGVGAIHSVARKIAPAPPNFFLVPPILLINDIIQFFALRPEEFVFESSFFPLARTMSTTGSNSGTSRNSSSGGTLRRQLKEEDLRYYPNHLRNRIFWGFVLVVVVVAVSVGVGAKAVSMPRENETTTGRPTAAPSTASVVNQFLNGLPPYSKELAFNNVSSPQAKALAWLENDPQYHDYELYRLNQRYALAVFYYSTIGTSRNMTDGWLSNDSECLWYQYDDPGPEDDNLCVEASRLTFLDLSNNELDGSIPTELELLTNLEYMYLLGDVLGGIHSEL
jgi:hypothetical protein